MKQSERSLIVLGFIAFLLALVVVRCEAQDITAWDLHPNAITDNNGYIVFKHIDPSSDAVAYTVYLSMNGRNVLAAVHLKQGGNCFLGQRSVKNGQSFLHWNGMPCNTFDMLNEIHTAFLKPEPPVPLERRGTNGAQRN